MIGILGKLLAHRKISTFSTQVSMGMADRETVMAGDTKQQAKTLFAMRAQLEVCWRRRSRCCDRVETCSPRVEKSYCCVKKFVFYQSRQCLPKCFPKLTSVIQNLLDLRVGSSHWTRKLCLLDKTSSCPWISPLPNAERIYLSLFTA